MHYLAVLGRQPELGLLELESLIGADNVAPFGRDTALITQQLDLNRLGGAQKLARIIYDGPERDINEGALNLDDLTMSDGKTTFGLSYYGLRANTKYVLATGLTLKKRLKSRGSIRFVTPQDGISLGAAQVKFNGLLRNGFELVVAVSQKRMIIAITEQIQDIDWYAVRDYQRPTRSAIVGMLPPKLAQIMVNTTSAPLVYDPFCGTGVVLQEALLLGRGAGGSDLSHEMVHASQDNLKWLETKRPDLKEWSVSLHDARDVTLPVEPLAIVSEGYLGDNLSKRPDEILTKRLRRELSDLYLAALRSFYDQLESNSEVTVTTPVWHTTKGWQPLGIIDQLTDMGYTFKSFRHVDGRNLIYRRPNQIVGRQLLVLRKP